MKAISIRQPWAWLIAQGYKDIENRSWATRYRGPVLIHASAAKPTVNDYMHAREILVAQIGELLTRKFYPPIDCFARGGIVGIATVTGCVDSSPSPWFFGPKGFTLADARPLIFRPMKGKLSFFETGIDQQMPGKGGVA